MSKSAERIQKLQEILRQNDLDGALYATGAHFMYLLDLKNFWFQRYMVTAWPGHPPRPTLTRPETILYVPAKGECLVLTIPGRLRDLYDCPVPMEVTYMDHFWKKLTPVMEGKRFAVGLSAKPELLEILQRVDGTMDGGKDGFEIVDGEEFVDQMRQIKDETEIEKLRTVAALTDAAMEYVVPMLKPGVTPFEVEDAIAEFGMSHGAADVSFTTMTLTIDRDYPMEHPFAYPRTRPYGQNVGVGFDFGYVLNGYASDYGRSFYVGKPSREAAESYRALQAAQQYMAKNLIPGKTRMCDISDLIYEGLKEFGRENQLKHHETGSQGHLIGIECHEFPWVHRDYDDVFRPGMVFCSEPKIYVENEIYMRVEDMILVTETGTEFLTNFDRELFALG